MRDVQLRLVIVVLSALGSELCMALPACVGTSASQSLRHQAEEASGMPSSDDSCTTLLQALGSVTLEFYPPPHQGGLGACTVFHYTPIYRYTYSFRTSVTNDTTFVYIYPSVSATVRITHDIALPRGLNDGTYWYRRLRRHEYDHVAISLDERPSLILRYLLAHLPPLRVPTPQSIGISQDLLTSHVRRAIDQRTSAVVSVIQSHYARLDSVTAHGLIALPSRRAFFDSLYSGERLARMRFPYTIDIAPLLASPRYRNALRFECD